MLAWLLVLVAGLSTTTASRDVHASLTAPWPVVEAPLLIEASEFLADESPDLFWSFLDSLAASEQPPPEVLGDDEAALEAALAVAAPLVSAPTLQLLRASLQLRAYAAAVELYRGASGAEAEAEERDWDHAVGPAEAPLTVLSGALHASEWRSQHAANRAAAEAGETRYVFRHAPVPTGRSGVPLQGYGVALDIKNVEYKVIDNDGGDAAEPLEGEVGGFDFDVLRARVPDRDLELRRFRQAVREALSADEEDEEGGGGSLQVWDMADLGLQATVRVMAAADPLRELRHVASDFPSLSRALSSAPTPPEELRETLLKFAKQSGAAMAHNKLLVNGRAVNAAESTFSVFSLLEVLREEARALPELHALGVDVGELLALAAAPATSAAAKGAVTRVNVRKGQRGVVTYLNNLEKDKQWEQASASVTALLRPSWQLTPIRKNLYHVLLVGDPSDPGVQEALGSVMYYIRQRVPVRLGVVLVPRVGEDEAYSVDPEALADGRHVARLFHHAEATHGSTPAVNFCSMLMQFKGKAEPMTVGALAESYASTIARTLGSWGSGTHLAEAFEAMNATTHDERMSKSRKFVADRGLPQAAGTFVANGVLLPTLDAQQLLQFLTAEQYRLGQLVMSGKVTDSTNVYQYLMSRKGVLKRYHPLVDELPADQLVVVPPPVSEGGEEGEQGDDVTLHIQADFATDAGRKLAEDAASLTGVRVVRVEEALVDSAEPHVFANGRGVKGALDAADMQLLVDSVSERAAAVRALFPEGEATADGVMRASALVAQLAQSPRDAVPPAAALSPLHSLRTDGAGELQIVAMLDPLSVAAQRLAPILLSLRDDLGFAVTLVLLPHLDIAEYPLKGYYRFVMGSSTSSFVGLPAQHLLTFKTDTPEPWNVQAVRTEHDLDNLQDSAEPVRVGLELKTLIVGGQCADGEGRPPNGLQLSLGNGADTLVMQNLGYFQLQAQPGAYQLGLEGRAQALFEVVDPQPVVVRDFLDSAHELHVRKRAGMEAVPLLESADSAAGAKTQELDVWASLSSKLGWGSGGAEEVAGEQQQETIHVFSVASGHLYERFLRVMMTSVTKRTSAPVKFWLLENFLSPTFKESALKMSAELGFEVEFVTYKWPHWLRHQTEKQRIIWGYKILFLDVLFPLDVHRIIYVDADQVLRADLLELWELDLEGHVYGFTPFCTSREETLGYQFWSTGYWADHLQGRPYHISALFVVDLDLFRRRAVGDVLRSIYDNLSRDPGSLANLDQDLPNYSQNMVPIFSLPQEWLWCESWCSSESLAQAKTVDLCNNPKHKEPKLDMAKRIVAGSLFPESWEELDEEVSSIISG